MPVYNGTYNWTGPMSGFNGTGPVDPGLMYAQERILGHQALLKNLTLSHPGHHGPCKGIQQQPEPGADV